MKIGDNIITHCFLLMVYWIVISIEQLPFANRDNLLYSHVGNFSNLFRFHLILYLPQNNTSIGDLVQLLVVGGEDNGFASCF